MEKMKCELGRLKARGEEERHALAKPRLVAVLRSKLRFTRFLQVPTGSHCLSFSPPSLQADCPTLLFHSPFSLLSRSAIWLALIFFPLLPFRLLDCPTFYYSTSHFLHFPEVQADSYWLSSSPLASG